MMKILLIVLGFIIIILTIIAGMQPVSETTWLEYRGIASAALGAGLGLGGGLIIVGIMMYRL
jgi:hypothetical protein